jgi:hypothetical protein
MTVPTPVLTSSGKRPLQKTATASPRRAPASRSGRLGLPGSRHPTGGGPTALRSTPDANARAAHGYLGPGRSCRSGGRTKRTENVPAQQAIVACFDPGELLKYRNELLMAQAYHGRRHREQLV